jgi:hypothetical protein
MVKAEAKVSKSESEAILAHPKKIAKVNSLMDDEEAALARVIGFADYLNKVDHDKGVDDDIDRESGKENKLDSYANELYKGEDIEMGNCIKNNFGDFGGVGNGVSTILLYLPHSD